MPLPVIVYAGAYAVGSLAGTALGINVVKKVLPSESPSCNTAPSTYFDLSKELDRLGLKNPF